MSYAEKAMNADGSAKGHLDLKNMMEKYTVGKFLGQGAFGEVCLVTLNGTKNG